VNSDMLLNLDFAETFLDYAGIEIPRDMQGKSFRENLSNSAPEPPKNWRKSFYYRYWANGGQHKVYAHYGLRTHRYKLIYYYCDPLKQMGALKDKHEPMWELFDLEKDPFEIKNVYEDPAYVSIVKELTAELSTKQKEVGDNPYIP
jgi:arylsulfatase A-like enzyme